MGKNYCASRGNLELLNEIDTILIDNISQKMGVLGMEPKDLAKASGISQSGIYKIIKAERFPGSDNLIRLARALKCTVNQLFEAPKSSKTLIEPLRKVPDPSMRELLLTLAALDDTQVGRYIGLMKSELAAARGESPPQPSQASTKPRNSSRNDS